MFIEIQNHNLFEIITLATSTLCILGHNLWLVSGKENKIEINTGDDFPDGETAISPNRIANFKVVSAEKEQVIQDFTVEGNSLIAAVTEKPKTAFIAAIELFAHPITLEADRFSHYIEDEDAEIFTKPDFVINQTTEPQRESYAKFAKVLVKNDAENNSIFTKPIGHKLEIILLETLSKDKQHLKIQVLFEGKPIKDLRVSSGAENLNGGRYSFHTRTDENGFANIEITENANCFIRTHYIRQHSDKENFDWESFWSSITF